MLRARDRGFGLRFEPRAEAVHVGGESHVSPRLWAILTLNRVRLYGRRHGRAATAAFRAAVILGEALRALRGSRVGRAALAALLLRSRRPPEVAGPDPRRAPGGRGRRRPAGRAGRPAPERPEPGLALLPRAASRRAGPGGAVPGARTRPRRGAVIGATLDALGASLRPRDTCSWWPTAAPMRRRRSPAPTARWCSSGGPPRNRAEPRRARRGSSTPRPRLGRRVDGRRRLDRRARVPDRCEETLATGADALQAAARRRSGRAWWRRRRWPPSCSRGDRPAGSRSAPCSVRLRGTGMVLRRPVVERHRSGPGLGDLWYGLDLASRACCLGTSTPPASLRERGTWRAASTQKLRYEAGRISAAREFLVPLLRRRSRAALEAAWFLATPPFATAAASLLAGLALAAAARSWARPRSGGPPAVAGRRSGRGPGGARAPARTYLALWRRPGTWPGRSPSSCGPAQRAARRHVLPAHVARRLPGPGGSAADVPSPSS